MGPIKGLKVTIVTNDQELEEFHPPVGEKTETCTTAASACSRKTVRYIQAIPNANFRIRCEVAKSFAFGKANGIEFDIFVDGQEVGGSICLKSSLGRQGYKYDYEGTETREDTRWQLRPFRWDNLKTSDEQCTNEEKSQYIHLGTIQVDVWRKKGKCTHPDQAFESWTLDGSEAVPEKAIKAAAVDLHTGLDAPILIEDSPLWEGTATDKKPYAVFIFKYRTKEALQSLGVLERPEELELLEEREVSTLTREELCELANRLKADNEARKVKVKTEKAEANLAQLAELKRGRDDESEDEDEDALQIVDARPVKKVCSHGGVVEDSD